MSQRIDQFIAVDGLFQKSAGVSLEAFDCIAAVRGDVDYIRSRVFGKYLFRELYAVKFGHLNVKECYVVAVVFYQRQRLSRLGNTCAFGIGHYLFQFIYQVIDYAFVVVKDEYLHLLSPLMGLSEVITILNAILQNILSKLEVRYSTT